MIFAQKDWSSAHVWASALSWEKLKKKVWLLGVCSVLVNAQLFHVATAYNRKTADKINAVF